MHVKPTEEKTDDIKKNIKEHKMEYDIVEDIKRAKEIISDP